MSTLEQTLNAARQKVLRGETLSLDEQRELVTQIRAGRFSAAATSAAAKTTRKSATAAKKGASDADLDADFDALGL